MAQDYDKDLYIVLVGTGKTTHKNFVDNVEDYIFGDRDEREATLLVPYTKDMTDTMGRILWDWAIADESEPNYPIHAYVEEGHKSIALAKKTMQIDEPGVTMPSGAIEAAMSDLVQFQKDGNEVVVVVIYDEESDVKLVGALKNYQSVPVLNLDGMIDSFPGFKTTDEILEEERKREEFETKEAIRIAAEKEQEKAAKKAAAGPAKKAAPRKRATTKAVVPDETPLTEDDVKTPAPRKRAAAKPKATTDAQRQETLAEESVKAAEPEYKVGDVVEVGGIPFVKHSELPTDLEPVRDLTLDQAKALVSSGALVPEDLPSAEERPDLWRDVSQAKAEVDKSNVTHYAVSKENLASLSEGITEMAQSFSKVMASMTRIIEGE